MATSRTVHCTFPKDLIKEPILYHLAKSFDVIPNIRGASISDEKGLVFLEVEGEQAEVDRAIEYLKEKGVIVDDLAPGQKPEF